MAGETVGALLCEAASRLRAAGVEAARLEARLLLGHVLGRAPASLPLFGHDPVGAAAAARFGHLVAERCRRVPSAYLTGRRGFWTLDLAVTPAVLVPRQDTETVVAAALDHAGDRAALRRVLDLGTGSGAILLALLAECPAAFGIGLDRSEAALAVARRNARACGFGERSAFLAGDWAAPVAGRFDLVVANPPYVDTETISALAPEVAAHEPRIALDGGRDGLDAFRAIIPALPALLAPLGRAVLEVGAGQAAAVAALCEGEGLRLLEMRRDLGGIVRAIALAAR